MTSRSSPDPGGAEYQRVQRLHDEAVSRVAKLRLMQSRLPRAIVDAEMTVADLAARLGLDPASRGGRRRRSRTTKPRVLAALPGSVGEIRRALGVSEGAVSGALQLLRMEGLVVKDPGYGGVWRRVERGESA